MVDRSFLLINFRSIGSLIYARTFLDTLYIFKQLLDVVVVVYSSIPCWVFTDSYPINSLMYLK